MSVLLKDVINVMRNNNITIQIEDSMELSERKSPHFGEYLLGEACIKGTNKKDNAEYQEKGWSKRSIVLKTLFQVNTRTNETRR